MRQTWHRYRRGLLLTLQVARVRERKHSPHRSFSRVCKVIIMRRCVLLKCNSQMRDWVFLVSHQLFTTSVISTTKTRIYL